MQGPVVTRYGAVVLAATITSLGVSASKQIFVDTDGGLNIRDYNQYAESSDPTTPGADTGRLYVRDHNSKSELAVVFPTGVAKSLAWEGSTVTTADATVTTCLSLAATQFTDNKATTVTVSIAARQTDGTNSAGYVLVFSARRAGAALTASAGGVAVATTESNGVWNAAGAVGANVLLFQVTGVAATSIDWTCQVTDWTVSP